MRLLERSLNGQLYGEVRDKVEIRVVTLDDFLAERGAGPVDLMKIDVETFEPQVLRGARRVLGSDRPIIFLEVLPTADVDALESIRSEFNYRDGLLLEDAVQWEDRVHAVANRHDHVFCPAEACDRFRKQVEEAGYRLIDPAR